MIDVIHICIAMKPCDGNFAENALEHGVAGLNVDGCRVGTGGDKIEGGCCGKGKLFDGGISQRATIDQSKGRWPANLIHDGSDEVVSLFPVSSANGYRANPSTNKTTWFGAKDGSHVEGERGHNDTGSAARFFQTCETDERKR